MSVTPAHLLDRHGPRTARSRNKTPHSTLLPAAGVTLVELMVGLVVGLIVVLALATLYSSTVRASADVLASVRLNQDLRAAMMIITSDLRRAGYWSASAARNPFPDNVHGGLRIWDADAESVAGESSEIHYWYDRNDDFFGLNPESADQIDVAEFFGFRLDSGALQMHDIRNPGNWIPLVGGSGDPVTITSLLFTAVGGERTPDPDGGAPVFEFTDSFECINTRTGLSAECEPDPVDWSTTVGESGDWIGQKRRVQITMHGTINGQQATISEVVKIRNDRRVRMP